MNRIWPDIARMLHTRRFGPRNPIAPRLNVGIHPAIGNPGEGETIRGWTLRPRPDPDRGAETLVEPNSAGWSPGGRGQARGGVIRVNSAADAARPTAARYEPATR
ncbi:hypothetical protein Raf01_93690 [Rugosimonospora africana]|uniref:Uncharacterized protein n=1 Tax=Rugosimonospora africana TaxID=556532 RepID=A0A8J3R497_9ACTN|nr:hypothetical protein Raf01_93690 [Rugosimonospora africana]